jgi:glycosyltransferase involved in cell wall biosynthesis
MRSCRSLRVALDGRHLTEKALRGMDRYTVALICELTRRGVEVTVFHRAREPIRLDHLKPLGCRVEGLRDRCGVHWEQVAVPLALLRGRHDLYHAPAERGVPLCSPCPVVLTIHSATEASYRDLIRRRALPGTLGHYLGYDNPMPPWHWRALLDRAQTVRADHILTPSEFSRQELIRLLGIPPGKVTVTPLAAPSQFLRPTTGEAERAGILDRLRVPRPYILYVGGYEAHKNVGAVLECFTHVRETRKDLGLVLAGTKRTPEELPARARHLGLRVPENVAFLQDLNDELPALYDGAEAFLSLSWRESFGLPALEALGRGLVPVVSGWGAAPEIVGDAGVLVDPRSPRAAARRLLDLLGAPDRARRAEAARARAARFSWQATAETTLRVYHRCLGMRRRHPPIAVVAGDHRAEVPH